MKATPQNSTLYEPLLAGVSGVAWLVLSGLISVLGAESHFTSWEQILLVASPLFGAAVLCAPLTLLEEHFGSRLMAFAGLCLTTIALLLGWLWAQSFGEFLVVGLLLGSAGCEFLSKENERITARLVGAIVGICSASVLAGWFGWRPGFGLALIPTLAAFLLVPWGIAGRNDDRRVFRMRDWGTLLRERESFWRVFFVASIWGGIVGLVSCQHLLFGERFRLSLSSMRDVGSLCLATGTALWVVARNYVSKMGTSALPVLLVGVGLMSIDLATSPALLWSSVLTIGMVAGLGLATSLILQEERATPTEAEPSLRRLALLSGCLLGGLLPLVFAGLGQLTGNANVGFVILAGLALVCAGGLLYLPQPTKTSNSADSLAPLRVHSHPGTRSHQLESNHR